MAWTRTASTSSDHARKLRQGRRHPVYRTVRLLLVTAALLGGWWTAEQLALTVEQMRFGGDRNEADFRETLVGETLSAALTMDFDAALTEALDEEDYERAAALYQAADFTGMPVSEAVRARYEDETDWVSSGMRAAWDGALGAMTGESESVAGLAATVTSDVFVPVYADARDILIQGGKLALGWESDEVILGLAVVGLAIPVAGPATDTLKAGLRYGRRSLALTQDIRRAAMRSVDVAGAKSWLRAAGPLRNPGQARSFIRQAELQPVLRAGSDLGMTAYHGGAGAAGLALRYADRTDDLAVFHRTAKTFGKEQSPGMMALLGKRLPKLAKTWRVSAPMAAKFLALSSMMGAAGMVLLGAASTSLVEWMGRRKALNWLATILAAR